MSNLVRVGSRGSKLALDQTQMVLNMVRAHHPHLTFEIEVIRTSGDEGKLQVLGAWVKEVEVALRENRIDMAVHSLKDVPTVLPEGLVITAIPDRADHRDCLVTAGGKKLADLPKGAKVGTSSMRRAYQIKALRPDLNVVELHGNIFTRMSYVERGELDAVILAVAGLERAGAAEKAAHVLEDDEMLCAVGQGALAIEVREDDARLRDILRPIHSEETALATVAERALLRGLGGGCRMPIAGHAIVEGDTLHLSGLLFSEDGSRNAKGKRSGPVAEADRIGNDLAQELMAQVK